MTPPFCLDCARPARILIIPPALREQMREATRPLAIARFDTLMHILARQRCADCFWWRLALLLGYCIL